MIMFSGKKVSHILPYNAPEADEAKILYRQHYQERLEIINM